MLVPPMSNVRRSREAADLGRVRSARPRRRPARRGRTPTRAARPVEVEHAARRLHDERRREARGDEPLAEPAEVAVQAEGERYASAVVVEKRSYSRNSGSTSLDSETCDVAAEPTAAPRRTRRSCAGSRNEKRKQTATASTSAARSASIAAARSSSSSGSDLAVGADALAHREAKLPRDERLRRAQRQVVERRTRLAGDLDHVPETRRSSGARCARRAARAARSWPRSCRARTPRPRVRVDRRCSSSAAITPCDWSPGVDEHLAAMRSSPSTSGDEIGERAADVDAHARRPAVGPSGPLGDCSHGSRMLPSNQSLFNNPSGVSRQQRRRA